MELSVIEKFMRPKYFCEQTNKTKEYISLNTAHYGTLIEVIDASNLSEWERMKMRQCMNTNKRVHYSWAFGTTAFFYYYGLTLLGFNNVWRPHFRVYRIAIGLSMGISVYSYLNTRPYKNRHIYELITQPEPRGAYVRTTISQQQPRIWSMISEQLSKQGYNFKEMNEYSYKEIMPTTTTKYDLTPY